MWSSTSGNKSAVSLATAGHVKFIDCSIDSLVSLTDASESHKRKFKRLLKHGKSLLVIDKSTNDQIDLSEFTLPQRITKEESDWTKMEEYMDAGKSEWRSEFRRA